MWNKDKFLKKIVFKLALPVYNNGIKFPQPYITLF